MYAYYLINSLLSSVIWDKTLMVVWSGEAAQDYNSLKIF